MTNAVRPTPQRIFIGDIHGQFTKLTHLLAHLPGEGESADRLIYLGDLIDNRPGPEIDHQSVLSTIRAQTETGKALCLMGNHEFNAVGWAMRHPVSGYPLRPHTENNLRQHRAFLSEMGEGSPQYTAWINWFMTLPLFHDFGDIRAVHACWDDEAIAGLRPWLDENNRLKPESWVHAFDPAHKVYHWVEKILKGPELCLPDGYSFMDKNGVERHRVRVRWWHHDAKTWRHLAQVQPEAAQDIPDLPLAHPLPRFRGAPVVIGHYTLSGAPALLSESVVCVDFNAAKGNNPLVGWMQPDGAGNLHNGRFLLPAPGE